MPTEQEIRAAVANAGLDPTGPITGVAAGFSNDVFDIADRYIFKVGKSDTDEELLGREIFLCGLLQGRVPAPKVLASDTTHALIPRTYIVYEKVAGDNLYMRWHGLDEAVRRTTVADICSYLRAINSIPQAEYSTAFEAPDPSWRGRITAHIKEHLSVARARHLLTRELARAIADFVSSNEHLLDENRMALTYYDAHFDNFIVADDRIVAMLDFERTDVMSIDYALDIIQRMVAFPTKYASEAAEPLITATDYSNLMAWFEEFYPDLFVFEEIEARLGLYSIEHDLRELIDWPRSSRARTELARIACH